MAFRSYIVIWIGYLILFGLRFLLSEPMHSRLQEMDVVDNMLILLGSSKDISVCSCMGCICLYAYLPAGDCANQQMCHALKCNLRIIGLIGE